MLDATRELLRTEGFAATTVQEVSRRTGVHPPAIYRRWPSRVALIEHAAFADLATMDVEPTGDLRADLRRFLRSLEATLGAPAARAAIPGLIATYGGGAVEPTPTQWVDLSVRPQFFAILGAAGPDAVDPTLDPDEIFDLVLGTVLAGLVIPTAARRRRGVDRLVDLVVRMLRPG